LTNGAGGRAGFGQAGATVPRLCVVVVLTVVPGRGWSSDASWETGVLAPACLLCAAPDRRPEWRQARVGDAIAPGAARVSREGRSQAWEMAGWYWDVQCREGNRQTSRSTPNPAPATGRHQMIGTCVHMQSSGGSCVGPDGESGTGGSRQSAATWHREGEQPNAATSSFRVLFPRLTMLRPWSGLQLAECMKVGRPVNQDDLHTREGSPKVVWCLTRGSPSLAVRV